MLPTPARGCRWPPPLARRDDAPVPRSPSRRIIYGVPAAPPSPPPWPRAPSTRARPGRGPSGEAGRRPVGGVGRWGARARGRVCRPESASAGRRGGGRRAAAREALFMRACLAAVRVGAPLSGRGRGRAAGVVPPSEAMHGAAAGARWRPRRAPCRPHAGRPTRLSRLLSGGLGADGRTHGELARGRGRPGCQSRRESVEYISVWVPHAKSRRDRLSSGRPPRVSWGSHA